MSFTEDLALLPINAREQQAKGFLPPVFRAIGHLLYVLAVCAATEDAGILTDEEALGELRHAKEHWDVLDTNGVVSTATNQTLANFGNALTSAIAEFESWDRDARIRNLRDLGNRAAGITTILDRELVGLRTSDAGHQL